MPRRPANTDRIAAALDANPQAAEDLDYYVTSQFGRRYISEQMALRHNIDYPDAAWYTYIRARHPRGCAGGKSTLCYLIDKHNIYRKVVVDMASRNESINAIIRALINIGFRCERDAINHAIKALGIDYKPTPPGGYARPGTTRPGHNCKATDEEVRRAMANAAPGAKTREIAESLGMSASWFRVRRNKILKGAKQ